MNVEQLLEKINSTCNISNEEIEEYFVEIDFESIEDLDLVLEMLKRKRPNTLVDLLRGVMIVAEPWVD